MPPSHLTGQEKVCEACGESAEDLIPGPDGAGYFCPTTHRCDYNQNIGWINADIQAGIDAEMGRARYGD